MARVGRSLSLWVTEAGIFKDEDTSRGRKAGRIAADIDPADAAALVIAASDGLQVQWLLDPGAVDVGRSLSILERLFPLGAELGTSA